MTPLPDRDALLANLSATGRRDPVLSALGALLLLTCDERQDVADVFNDLMDAHGFGHPRLSYTPIPA